MRSLNGIPAALPPRIRLSVGRWISAATTTVGLPIVIVVSFIVSEWLIFDVSLRNAFVFIGYELGFLLVPGVLLYIVISGRTALGLEQVALGWALGYALELAAFIATAASGERSLFPFYPIVIGAIAIPYIAIKARRGAFERIQLRAPRWLWAVAALQIILIGYFGDLMFATAPPPDKVPHSSYYQDLVWFISIAAEARHHWPLEYPNLAGLRMHYHYFVNLHMASISQVTGASLFQIVFRLYQPALLVLVPLQFVYASRVISRRAAAGVLSAAVFFFLSSFGPTFSVPNFFFPDLSQVLFATVFFLPAVALIAGLLERAPGWFEWRRLVLLLIFLSAAVGAKATTVPVILGGLGLLALYAIIVDRGLLARLLLPTVAAFVVLGVARLVLYPGTSGGATFQLLVHIRNEQPFNYLSSHLPHVAHSNTILWLFGTVLTAAKITSGLALGLWGAWLARRDPRLRSRVWLLAMLIAGILIFFSLSQVSGSEVYFYVFGYEAGCILAGIGLVALWDRFVPPLPFRTPVIVGVVVVGLAVWAIDRPLEGTPTYFWVALTAPEPGAGYTVPTGCSSRDLSPGLYRGLRWLADNASPDAVLAVNNQYLTRDECRNATDGRYFYYSAFAERRVMLEGYYSDDSEPYPSKPTAQKHPSATPFPQRFRINNAIFLHGDAAAVREAKRLYGVRYLVADKLHGLTVRQSASVRRLGKVVFANSAVDIVFV